jgi:hypothetical protein
MEAEWRLLLLAYNWRMNGTKRDNDNDTLEADAIAEVEVEWRRLWW